MKVAIINRGISGSGKSTFNKLLANKALNHKQNTVVHSTDDLFMVDGKYQFDVKKLGDNHKQNYANFVEALRTGFNIVICDNTNTKQWEYQNYVSDAQRRGYTTIGVFFFPDKVENHLARNTHGLTKEILMRQKSNLLNNIKTELVEQEYQIKPDSFFDDIDRVAQAIIGKNIF